MATRLLLVAHAPVTSARDLRFAADSDDVAADDLPEPIGRRVRGAECGAGIAMVRTASALGLTARAHDAWNGRRYGDWSRRSFADLQADELQAWVRTPHEAPPGGESVAAMLARVERRLRDGFDDGLHVAVTSTDVLRVAVLLITGAGAASYPSVDVASLDALEVTLNGNRRAIRSLRPYPDWL